MEFEVLGLGFGMEPRGSGTGLRGPWAQVRGFRIAVRVSDVGLQGPWARAEVFHSKSEAQCH
jgi:hypothetical protein